MIVVWLEAEWTLLSALQRQHHGKSGSYGNSCLVDYHISNLPSFTLFSFPNSALEWLVYSHFGRQLYAHSLCLLLGRKAMTNLDSILKSRDITLPTKVHLVKAMVFPVVRYGCESWTKESLVPKNWCFWSVVLEKMLESPLDCKVVQPVNPKGNQSWILFGRTDAEAETPIFWPPDVKKWLIGKDPDGGKDGSWEEKGTTEDAMVGWHHQLYEHEFE